jgi:UDP-2,3-diacylglucosamine pyrophosphatase LpxH
MFACDPATHSVSGNFALRGCVVRRALVLSDLHLGWVVCTRTHRELLDHLPAAADDADVIILNGDIIDAHRGVLGPAQAELVQRLAALCDSWRRDGRHVVIVEGNHDPAVSPLGSTVWRYDFEGHHGERIRVLHGHRFADRAYVAPRYEHWGRHPLGIENWLYARLAPLRAAYRYGPGWVVGAWGLTEDRLWRPRFAARVAPLLADIDTLVYGHFHFGPARTMIANVPAWRSASWVAEGHLGTVNRMLRYRDGSWERIGLVGGRWIAIDDGR